MKILIIAWAVIAAVVLAWPRPSSFNARWVSMPLAMSWDMLNRVRKATERPTAMTYTHCKWPDCKRS